MTKEEKNQTNEEKNQTNEEKKYFAFISYSHKDKAAAKKLHDFMEGYKLPANLNGKEDLPKRIRPIFRDEAELKGGELTPQIQEALRNSRYLIVVCSPNSAKSKYVNEEIEYFKSLGGETKILPYIIAGKATTDEDPECCYAPALKENQKKYQIVGGDVRDLGDKAAALKIMAPMLGVEFASLHNRFAQQERKKRNIIITVSAAFALLMAGVTVWILFLYKGVQESKSIILAENAMNRIGKGDYLGARRKALEAITLSYSPEAERVLRQSWENNDGILEGHFKVVNSVSWSPDGKYLASGSWDKTVKIWDAKSGKELKTLKGHSHSVNSVCCSPDGRYLASGSPDRTVKIWDVNSGECIRTLEGHSKGIRSVCWSPDGKYLASSSGEWNDEGEIGEVFIWDVNSGACLKTLEVHSSYVWSLSFSPDGKYLASGSEDSTVIIWNINNGQNLKTLEGHSSEVNSVSWSPDGKYLASGLWDGIVIIWDAKSGKKLKTLEGHSWMVTSVCWSPDGKYLASGLWDRTVGLWNLYEEKKHSSLKSMPKNIYSSRVSPDGKYSAEVEDKVNIIIKYANSGECIRTLQGHFKDVNSFSWSPDGKYLASNSRYGTVKVWDTKSGLCLQTFEVHNGEVLFVGFTSDGRKIIAETFEGVILQWDFPPLDELIEKTKSWAGK